MVRIAPVDEASRKKLEQIASRRRELAAKARALQAEIDGLDAEARQVFEWMWQGVQEGQGKRGLRKREQAATVNNMYAPVSHPLATSAGRGKDDSLIKAANAKGHTLRSLADAAGCTVSTISMARRGVRKIRGKYADTIADLTGFKATAANWPGGISR